MHYQQDVIAAYDQAGWERGREEGEKKGLERGREEGRAEGEAIGLEKGGREKALAIARELKARGIPLETILECTGLARAELLPDGA